MDTKRENYCLLSTDLANDAKAEFYEVDTGPLDVSNITTGAAVWVRGHVKPFGKAPADFEAMTIIDLSAMTH